MARVGIKIAEVAAAFEKILSQGEQPTAEKIQTLLGKSTPLVIQKYINQITNQSRLDLNTQDVETTPVEAVSALPETPPFSESIAPKPIRKLRVERPDSRPIIIEKVEPLIETLQPEKIEAQPEPSQPAFLEPAPAAGSFSSANMTTQGRRPFRRERFIRNPVSPHNNNLAPLPSRSPEFEESITVEPPLEQLSEETLLIKVRRLESTLMKEQMRREVAERTMKETKNYADSIKEQIAFRINDLQQNMDIVIEQLKNQLRDQKQSFEQDLKHYQEHLAKANEKIASLLKK